MEGRGTEMAKKQDILIGTAIYSRKKLTQANMSWALVHGIVPRCLCKGNPGIPMHIARHRFSTRLMLRRNPGSGFRHAWACPSHCDFLTSISDFFFSSLRHVGISVGLPKRKRPQPSLPISRKWAASLECAYAACAIFYAVIHLP